MEQWHRGLTADMFVIRDGRFLTLRRVGLGAGFEYLPGGIVERGEDPMDAAIRETTEECGLTTRDVRLLRVWAYPVDDYETVHATYVGFSDAGEIVLSAEHDASRWTSADGYTQRWLRPKFDDAFPSYAGFFAQVRRNVELVRRFL